MNQYTILSMVRESVRQYEYSPEPGKGLKPLVYRMKIKLLSANEMCVEIANFFTAELQKRKISLDTKPSRNSNANTI